MNNGMQLKFMRTEALGGILLMIALLCALVIANSPVANHYDHFLDIPIQVKFGKLELAKPLLLWVNDGLMAIFFLMLSLEIKREILVGELSTRAQLTLPLVGALGGIIVPALIYIAFNWRSTTLSGWPISTTTDIAFTLGVVALLGKWVPTNLKILLVGMSIVDDILAIAIIAFFYTDELSTWSLYLSSLGIFVLIALNYFGTTRITPYVLLGIFVWVCVVKSGVHATLAGVVVGFCIPFRGKDKTSPLRHLEHKLHPWVAYFILPLFVFVNGGVIFHDMTIAKILSPVSVGIACGLVIGKTLGIFGCLWLLIKLGCAQLPKDCNWLHLLGLSALMGIGFTMSLFLAALAFNLTPFENIARQGVLIGSFVAGVIAVIIFYFAAKSSLTSSQ